MPGFGKAIARNGEWMSDGRVCVLQPELTHLTSALKQPPLESPDPNHSPPTDVQEASGQALQAQLTEARALEEERLARIHHLEQALDQSLASLAELQSKLKEQGLLEAQLAATEKFACVQQQAIARLKLRIKHQQQAIESLSANLAIQDTLDDAATPKMEQLELSFTAPALAHESAAVPAEATIPTLEAQIQSLQAALADNQHRITELEFEAQRAQELANRLQGHLETAQQQVQDLSVALGTYEARIAQLDAQLDADAATSGRKARTSARAKSLGQQNRAIATLGQDLARAQIKVEELELEMARQLRVQSLWQHNCREMEAECDRYRTRVSDLEQQSAEMQEQIFQQARQASEFEAAIQHWKDRYHANRQQILRLRELLEEAQLQALSDDRIYPALGAVFSELLAVIELTDIPELDGSQSSAEPGASRFNSLDVPDFLLRRRSYRPR